MPDPIISPTINDSPFKYVMVLCFSRDAPFRSMRVEVGVPRAEYAPTVVESGKRLEAKSNADDTEYDRPWVVRRGVSAGRFAEMGLSSERETLREEASPEREEDCDLRDEVGEEEAREASSSESRGG